MFHGIRIATAGLIQQFLQSAAVVERLLDLWDELVWNIDANPSPLAPAIEDVTRMLIASRTRVAVLADAGASSQTQRSQRGRPQTGGFGAEPALHVGWRFNLGRHIVYVP